MAEDGFDIDENGGVWNVRLDGSGEYTPAPPGSAKIIEAALLRAEVQRLNNRIVALEYAMRSVADGLESSTGPNNYTGTLRSLLRRDA